MRSVELFAGAGGSALGIAQAGFAHEAVLERDRHSCATLRENQRRGVRPVADWRIFQTDVRDFDYGGIRSGIDLLAGGPPCQPFSLGGKHRAWHDDRDMFPELVRAVRYLQPRAVLVENVKGLLRESFAAYFGYILLRIAYPELERSGDEDWREHLGRLERHHTHGRHDGLCYNVVFRLLNAADYGVPQRRERVFIVAFRSDVAAEWSFPPPTHSQDALLRSQWVTREYWERHALPVPPVPDEVRPRLAKLSEPVLFSETLPWLTVRDALCGLPQPGTSEARGIANHEPRYGARPYPGHTGSPVDDAAKTLKAGDHGVPGGENMVAFADGTVRYFTTREAARIQGFPDDYHFVGSWTEAMRQIGNAVPVPLAAAVGARVAQRLLQESGSRG